jgi:hypothetical protein
MDQVCAVSDHLSDERNPHVDVEGTVLEVGRVKTKVKQQQDRSLK